MRKHEGIRGAVRAAIKSYPEAFLDEATVFVNEVQALMEDDVRVSPESVRRVLVANGFPRKVIETNFRQRNEAALAAWVAAQWEIPLQCRVNISLRPTAADGRPTAGERCFFVALARKDMLTPLRA